jgi:hypothetical protein
MAAGDVLVTITNATTAAVDTAVTAQRVSAGASAKWMAVAIGPECQQVMVISIEE